MALEPFRNLSLKKVHKLRACNIGPNGTYIALSNNSLVSVVNNDDVESYAFPNLLSKCIRLFSRQLNLMGGSMYTQPAPTRRLAPTLQAFVLSWSLPPIVVNPFLNSRCEGRKL